LSYGAARASLGPNQSVQAAYDRGVRIKQGARLLAESNDTVVVEPAGQGLLRVGDRAYRGRMLLFRSAEGDLAVVNVLGLEQYLAGVVPCEIGPINQATIEAARAQAVAARSFTLNRLGRRKGLGHDLFDSYARDQEYRGALREEAQATQAVQATRGEVLLFQGNPVSALYHANCGGTTSTGDEPYLKGVRDTPGHSRAGKAFCSGQRNSTWRVSVGRESLNAVVSRFFGRKVVVRSCRLETEKASGRVKRLYFATDRGEVKMPGASLRAGLGLKSQTFKLSFRGGAVVIEGRGYGHGVGMCQDGAVAMALAGYRYRDILRHYYTGASLKKLY
jgi:stage II sporulation protein D